MHLPTPPGRLKPFHHHHHHSAFLEANLDISLLLDIRLGAALFRLGVVVFKTEFLFLRAVARDGGADAAEGSGYAVLDLPRGKKKFQCVALIPPPHSIV